MCTACDGGISGHIIPMENTKKIGRCFNCGLLIYSGMICSEEDGKLVCGAHAHENNLHEYRYSPAFASALVFMSTLPKIKIAA